MKYSQKTNKKIKGVFKIMKKKLFALSLATLTALSLTACGNASAPAASAAPAASSQSSAAGVYTVGICQLVQHPALDAATEGFRAALTDKLGADGVVFEEQNAAGDSPTCSTIVNQFVTDGVDLIMANATPALQAAQSATADIPILGTSVTDYSSALGIDDWTGATGTNISGTSDLAPLDGQAAMLNELFPDAKTVGILYCSSEANSVYQADTITPFLQDCGYTVNTYTFSDSNDVAAVTGTACNECDVLYIPTDNTAATCAESINNVAQPAGIPIVCGEENLCKGCGVATLSISYYDLGYATGEMAYEILVNGADPASMDIQYAPAFTKEYNATICSALGMTVPTDYTAIAE
jgi:putative ABC transport system substrate-binding protein